MRKNLPLPLIEREIVRLKELYARGYPFASTEPPPPEDRALWLKGWVNIRQSGDRWVVTLAKRAFNDVGRPRLFARNGRVAVEWRATKCDVCEGDGQVLTLHGDHSVRCPQCHGHGNVTEPRRKAYRKALKALIRVARDL